jgi:hypothetical protein
MAILDAKLKLIKSKYEKMLIEKIDTLERLLNDHKNDEGKSQLLSEHSDGRDLYERKLGALRSELTL